MEILNHEITTGVNCFRIGPFDDAEAEKWWQGREGGKYPAWILEQPINTGGSQDSSGLYRVMGWGSLSRWSSYEGYDRTAEISIWLRPAAQGRGYGKQLFGEILRGAQGSGFRVILSRIEATNRPSIALHARFGFRPVGTLHRVGEKFGRLLDVLLMELELPAPEASS